MMLCITKKWIILDGNLHFKACFCEEPSNNTLEYSENSINTYTVNLL